MALFQTSVLKKYLKQQDKAAVDKAYKAYTKYFLHPTIQENIRNSKEEQFQATFLNELFVKILGYTINPSPKFNLTTELKNETGSKKADGAILNSDNKAIAVIELKGTNTIDLESIRQQAFDYKANHKECVYVVTSNFEKLRFYINNAVDFEEFNLFMLSPDRFALLYLCLHKEHILSGLPEKIKNDSVLAEEDITKKFYADYSVFKRELFRDLVKLNLKNEVFRNELSLEDAERGKKNIKLTLFKKSQKLIDRFLFIFFAEDRGLLPPNSITLIINEYNQLKELDRAEPLYDTYKLYFKYLDQGRAGTDKKAEIFAYNGGLFKPDAVLDSLRISDELLLKHTSTLTKYDFESQVDVNILGHIFENSLNEIESVNAEIEGTDFDKQKTKRKKDGVFYTPKYITKYIVDNTVGKLCEEKKVELSLDEEEYHKGRKNRQKKTLEDLLAKLDTYREWLLSLTICDPACGSGAFLNQALNFLIREHTYIDELKQALLGGALVLSDIENTILERNIYGVDLNEESVEIAKLSLWLRTAQPRRKLNSLNNNIKCGNSLIDDKKVAGDKAFTWEKEFPDVFRPKAKKAYHITWPTHNTRVSDRMIEHNVKLGDPVLLTEEEELHITATIADIVKEDKLNALAYNICVHHVHLLLVCEEEEIPNIVRKLKGKSSQKLKEYKGIAKEEKHTLWAQKYNTVVIESDEQEQNTIDYIRTNREKHDLSRNKGLQPLVREMVTDLATAYRVEYKGGFDVVIGNPPYVNANELKKSLAESQYNFLKKNFQTAKGTVDLYIYFFEKGISITKSNGWLSYITPNRFLSASYGRALREFLINQVTISRLIDYSDKNVFPDASTYPVITFLNNNKIDKYKVLTGKFDERTFETRLVQFPSHKLEILDDSILGFLLNDKLPISEKIINQSVSMKRVGKVNATSTAKEADEYSSLISDAEGIKIINSGTIDPFCTTWGLSELTDKGTKYLNPKLYLDSEIVSQNRISLYKSQKIIISKIGLQCEAFFDQKAEFASINTNCIHSFDPKFSPEYVTCWLNSKLYNYLFECFFDGLRMSGGYLLYSAPNLKNTYIKEIDIESQNVFKNVCALHQSHIQEFNQRTYKFLTYLQSQFGVQKWSKKLEKWYELEFGEFISELNKAITKRRKEIEKEGLDITPPEKLTKLKEMEWMEVFETKKAEAQALQAEIDKTDREIDVMVYELYGLTEEEIAIVEGS